MDVPKRSYEEKRDFIRMRIDSPLAASVSHGQQRFEARCLDLSGGGMRLEMESPPAIDCEVEVSVASAHGHSPALHARARVARIEDGEGEMKYCGLEIIEML